MGIYDNGHIIHYDEGDSSLERNDQNIIISKRDSVHVVKDGETLHNIAYFYYKDSSKWYLIAEANGIMNPFTEVITGMKLTIPNYGLN